MNATHKIGVSILAVATCLILSGCNGNESSPQGVVQMMGSAVRSGSLTDFQSCLDGEALKVYGNPEALGELRRETSGMELTLGDALFTGEQASQGDGSARATYDVAILSRKAGSTASFTQLVNAQVVCEKSLATQPSVTKSAFFMVPNAQADSPRRAPASVCRITLLTPA